MEFRRGHVWLWVSLATIAAIAGFSRHAWYAVVAPEERAVQIIWAAGFVWMGAQ